MKTMNLKYVQTITSNGATRFYFRRGRLCLALPGIPGSPEFSAAYQLALIVASASRDQASS